MSFVGDLFGGGSQTVGTQVTTTEPPEYVKPYLEYGISEAKDLYNTPRNYYPGQTYTDFSPTSLEGLNRLETRAMVGNPLVGQASDFTSNAIAGNFLNPAAGLYADAAGGGLTNAAIPMVTDMAQGGSQNAAISAIDPIARGNFDSSTGYNMLMDTARGNFLAAPNPFLDAALQPVIDRVQSQYALRGRLGSAANKAAITNALAPIYAQNFENERARQIAAQNTLGGAQASAASLLGNFSGSDLNRQANALSTLGSISGADLNRQLSATGGLGNLAQTDFTNRYNASVMAPQLAAQDYTDIGQLLAAGEARDAKAGEALASDITRFNFFENEPSQRLANYLAMIAGGQVGQNTSRPIYGDPLKNALGNIGTAAQAAFYLSKMG